jgi:hypothetical protein
VDAVRALVIYESLTGNTRRAAELIGAEFVRNGWEATVCSDVRVELEALSHADVVVVGSWVDGIFVIAQRPGRAGRLRALPYMRGKRAAVYCTYALNTGKTIEKMTSIVEGRGASVLGGMAIRRDDLDGGTKDFVERLLAALAPA